MKILVIAFSKIKYAPYVNFYLENIDSSNNDVHLLYWNRDLKEEDTSHLKGITLHEFLLAQQDEVPKKQKIKSFWKFRQYAIRLMRKEKFDFVFVLTSLPGVLLYDYLQRHYRGKYIFDYRDSTYEKIGLFQRMIHGLVRGSKATFVSSDAFRVFLPEDARDKTYTSHNILWDSLAHREDDIQKKVVSNKIRIAFWGFVRELEINQLLIQKFSEDERFELHFYGREERIALKLKDYVTQQKIRNVFFHGEYRPEDRYKFIRDTDIIHNIYCNPNMMLAMANKYYDGAIFKLPQLCIKNSYMAQQGEKAGIAKGVDPFDPDFLEDVYSYYSSIDRNTFNKACDRETDRVCKEYQKGCQIIRSSIL